MQNKSIRDNYLRQCSEAEQENISDWRCIFSHAISCLACGKPLDEEFFRTGLDKFYSREDCIDFAANIIIRMFYMYKSSPLWSHGLKLELRELMLDLDYWFNVKRSKNSRREIMWTENHVLLWHTCEYLACQLYPDEVFRGRGKKGKDIMETLKPKILDWIHVKAMVGFSEWDSNTYMAENYMSLLNLCDFALDREIREKTENMLHLISFGMAVNSYKGVYGCTHGRAYAKSLLNGNRESTRAIQAMLWNIGGFEDNLLELGAVTLALSKYETPVVIDLIAWDAESIMESREQQSFAVEDGPRLGKGFVDEEDLTLYWHNMGYTHVGIIDKNVEICQKYGIKINHQLQQEYEYVQECRQKGVVPEPCRCVTYMPTVNKITYKTPDYMLSCAQDFRKGERGFQQHIWQATLDSNIAVFTNHPGKYDTGGRPDLWAGNDIFPRAVQHRNTLICIYHIDHPVEVPYTHAYFPRNAFDEVYEKDSWIFGRKGKGYIALRSQHRYEWTHKGKWKDAEVICRHKENIWICQMGRAVEDGEFSQFISCVLAGAPAFHDLHVQFSTTKGDLISFGWEEELHINDTPVNISSYPRFNNHYCHADRYTGEYNIHFKGRDISLNF